MCETAAFGSEVFSWGSNAILWKFEQLNYENIQYFESIKANWNKKLWVEFWNLV